MRRHARKRTHTNSCKLTHTHVRNCVCIFSCKQTQTHADTSACAYIYARAYARSIVYRRSGFDCEIPLLRIASFFHNSQSKESQEKDYASNNNYIARLAICNHSKSQFGLYSAICNRLTTQSKPDLRYTRTQFAQTNDLTTRIYNQRK